MRPDNIKTEPQEIRMTQEKKDVLENIRYALADCLELVEALQKQAVFPQDIREVQDAATDVMNWCDDID